MNVYDLQGCSSNQSLGSPKYTGEEAAWRRVGVVNDLAPGVVFPRSVSAGPPSVVNMWNRLLPLLTLLLIPVGPAWSQRAQSPADPEGLRPAILDAGRRTMVAEPMPEGERIVLDGVLDEPVWQRTAPARDFIQQDPVLGGTPTERTEVRIAFTGTALYMGVICYDSEPDLLLGNTMKRDELLSADDRFMWTMDPFLDQQNGYFFEMNPSGLMADQLLSPAGSNRDWDGIWNAKVHRSELGWTLEIEIPFRTISFDPGAPAWGINFQRTVRRKNEENLWTGYLRNQGLRRLEYGGLLTGITDVSRGVGLDVVPYVAGSLFDAPGADEPQARDGTADVGVDLSYNLTPSLRANLTVNTDFAETEADQRLVNLTRFPLFFPEKRSFFLDGATLFDFFREFTPVRPFFSRRIGLDEEGQPQPILIGSKLIGQAGAEDVGLLYVRTDETATAAGEDFAVARLRHRFWAQSYVGAIYTGRHTRREASDDLHTAGGDFRLATATFRGDQNLELSGFFLWNTNPLDTGESSAHAVRIGLPNDPWDVSVSARSLGENVDPAVGFVRRTGFRDYNPRIAFVPRPASHPWIRLFRFELFTNFITDMDNRWLTRNIQWKVLGIDTHSQDTVAFSIWPQFERLQDDFEISDGVVLPEGEEYSFTRFQVQGQTANRRVLATNVSYVWGSFFSGDHRELTIGANVRPLPGVRVQLQGEWNDVSLPEGSFDTQVYRVISDTQFNPWVFVVNTLQYDSVSDRLGWQARFRWTFRAGNDLFVVYTQNWVNEPVLDRFITQDRRAATKLVYTQRF